MDKLKTLTYGMMHFAVAVTVTYLLTGSAVAALSIGVVEPLVQTVAYAVHEKLWHGVGKRRRPGGKTGGRDFGPRAPA